MRKTAFYTPRIFTNSHSSEKVLSHSYRNVLFYNTCTISAVFHAYEAGLKLYFSLKRGKSFILFLLLLALTSQTGNKSSHISLHLRNDALVVSLWVFMGIIDVYGFLGVYRFLWVYGYLWVS